MCEAGSIADWLIFMIGLSQSVVQDHSKSYVLIGGCKEDNLSGGFMKTWGKGLVQVIIRIGYISVGNGSSRLLAVDLKDNYYSIHCLHM